MPRVKPEYKAERRAQIIDAARTCFARDGFHRTTLQDVFAEAGLSAGAVYNYFQSKDELILAIADERHAQETAAFSQHGGAQDPIEALSQIGAHFIDTYLAPSGAEKRRIAVQTWSEAMLNPAILASVREGIDKPLRETTALIRSAQKSGRLQSGLEPEGIARALAALFHGFLLQKLWDPKLDVAACRRVFEHFIASLSTPSKR